VLKGDGVKYLPLEVEVEPVMTYQTEDLLNGVDPQFRMWKTEIESCTQTMSKATIRVRLSPVEGSNLCGEDSDLLNIKEARAIQLNSYPPKPRFNVDLYTSSVFGETAICVTLVVRTHATKSGETPKLQVELVLS
jgi:hypothetical protein